MPLDIANTADRNTVRGALGIVPATSAEAGLMTAADKIKVDGLDAALALKAPLSALGGDVDYASTTAAALALKAPYAAIGNDANYAETVSGQIALKLDASAASAWARGGLINAADQPSARTYLGLGSAATQASTAFAAAVHGHAIGDVTGLQGALDAKLASASYTASDVLTKLKTVDGTGSGLDADVVRGTTPSAFGLARLSDADAASARSGLGINGLASIRNRHLNSAMQICQDRATGATVVLSAPSYAFDGVLLYISGGGALTCSQVAKTTPGGSPYRFRASVSTTDTSISASDIYCIVLPIEGVDVAGLMFGSASARSFVWRGVVNLPAGTYGLSFLNGATDRSYVITFTVSAGEAGTDKLITAIVPGDTAGTWIKDASGIGIAVRITIAAGTSYQTVTTGAWQPGNYLTTAAQTNAMASASNVFEIADIGLYAGTELPSWEMPSYADDLRKCQRYYEILSYMITSPDSSGTSRAWWAYKVTKRAVPALSAYGSAIVDTNGGVDGQRFYASGGMLTIPVGTIANARL